MMDEVNLSPRLAFNLRGLQKKASGSLHLLIKMSNEVFSDMDGFFTLMSEIEDIIKPSIPEECPYYSRLAQTYALDLACTYMVSWKWEIDQSILECVHST